MFWIKVLLLITLSFFALAKEYESYSHRPDILKIKSEQYSKGMIQNWEEFKRAHLEVTVMLSELYKKHDIYFLARDSELLYDTARIIFKDDPKNLKRMHLLNISSANMEAPHVMDYLKQEGISVDSLSKGKKVLFVDTGFKGSIPNKLKAYFPLELQQNIQAHLLSSSTHKYPSARTFLTAINPEAAGLNLGNMIGVLVKYERMPRYTDRSTGFELINDKWQPMSKVGQAIDGVVSKKQAIKYSADLKNYLQGSEAQNLIKQRTALWKELVKLSQSGDETKIIQRFKSLVGDKELGVYGEAIVRDFFEASAKNGINTIPNVDLTKIGLGEVKLRINGSNKNEIIFKYPEWKDILNYPTKGIRTLLEQGDIATLAKIIDNLEDTQFYSILATKIGEADTPQNRALIKMLIEKEKINFLSVNTFTQAATEKMDDLYRLTILKALEKEDMFTLSTFAVSTFTQPHTKNMYPLYKMVIDAAIANKDIDTLKAFTYGVFRQPHTASMVDLYQTVFQKMVQYKETNGLKLFAETLDEPHTLGAEFESMREILKQYNNDNPDWKKIRELTNEKFKNSCLKATLKQLSTFAPK